MKRGDLVTVTLQGDQGKPRPALVVQADLFDDLHAVTLLPLTGTLVDAPLIRVTIMPTPQNGLAKPSQIMIDKLQTPLRTKVGQIVGHLDDGTLLAVNRAMAVFLGLA